MHCAIPLVVVCAGIGCCAAVAVACWALANSPCNPRPYHVSAEGEEDGEGGDDGSEDMME